MRTRTRFSSRRVVSSIAGLVGAALALLVVGQSLVDAGASEIDAAPYRLPGRDLATLADVKVGAPPTVAIKPDAAIAAVNAIYDTKEIGATVTPFLETATVPGTFGTERQVRDTPVWIVRLSGMAIEQGGPVTAEGKPAAIHILTTAYVFLDASTGAFLFTIWTE